MQNTLRSCLACYNQFDALSVIPYREEYYRFYMKWRFMRPSTKLRKEKERW